MSPAGSRNKVVPRVALEVAADLRSQPARNDLHDRIVHLHADT